MIGEHVLRHAGGCLIDSPDQPLLARPPGHRRVALRRHCLARPYRDDGWVALLWLPGERGWRLPSTLAVGDVLEFGVAVHAEQCTIVEHRWWGWLDHTTERALLVHGPHDHPAAAHRQARRLVDEVRLAQLAAPHVDGAHPNRSDSRP